MKLSVTVASSEYNIILLGTMSPLILFVTMYFFANTESKSVQNLTFMFVTSFGQSGFDASGVVPAADIALEDINNRSDVLQGYHLMYDKVKDSKVCAGPGSGISKSWLVCISVEIT